MPVWVVKSQTALTYLDFYTEAGLISSGRLVSHLLLPARQSEGPSVAHGREVLRALQCTLVAAKRWLAKWRLKPSV